MKIPVIKFRYIICLLLIFPLLILTTCYFDEGGPSINWVTIHVTNDHTSNIHVEIKRRYRGESYYDYWDKTESSKTIGPDDFERYEGESGNYRIIVTSNQNEYNYPSGTANDASSGFRYMSGDEFLKFTGRRLERIYTSEID